MADPTLPPNGTSSSGGRPNRADAAPTPTLVPTDLDLIRSYHQIGAMLNERLQKGRKFVPMDNNAIFIYSADSRSPTGVTIEVAWQVGDGSAPAPSPSPTPTATPAPTPTPTPTQTPGS